jgi:spermidine/putrescine-binding protein
MTVLDKRMTRAQALKAGALGIAGFYLSACGSGGSSAAGGSGGKAANIAWLTWADHYAPDQLKAVHEKTGITARPALISDNSETLLKLKSGGSQIDIASADALWVPRFFKEGLIDSFALGDISASSQLYSAAREFPFWQDNGKYMAYPVSWSTQQLYYNTDKVKTKPDSWHALADPKYKGRIVLVNAPTDMMAVAGLATGAKEPFKMTTGEIASAKQFLASVKPNVLKLASQANDTTAALIDGSAWIAFNNLGTDLLVKEGGGPNVEVAFPSEGVIGFIDGEQIVKKSKVKDRFAEFMNATQDAEWIAANFLKNGRPLFNEKAYKLLVNQGKQERADRLLYNQPDKALEMVLHGPSANEQAYVDAFNEVFGA